MNGFGRHSAGAYPAAAATVHEVRAAALAVDRALGGAGLAGPADVYHVIGSLSLVTRTLRHSSARLAAWLREEEHRRWFTVREGPFVDDPEAAATVAAQSLVQASLACQEVFDALERAQMAMAHVGAERGPAKGTARRSLLRRHRP